MKLWTMVSTLIKIVGETKFKDKLVAALKALGVVKNMNDVRDIFRVAVSLGLAVFVLWLSGKPLPDSVFAPALTASGMIMFIAAFTHIIRKILFRYIDLKAFVSVVLEERHPVACALIVCAFIYLIGIIYQSFVVLLR